MKNILLIVDPQNDFISGSLAVENAEEKMLKLSNYLNEKGSNYDKIYVTMDSHPENHCSFKENGGIWPKHCITNTPSWEIFDHLNKILNDLENVEYYHKGTEENKEEYSIFENNLDGVTLLNNIKNIIEKDFDTFIDVCGIAGDYCVLETIKGLTELINNDYIYILEEFTASIDGGEKLLEYAENNDINVVYKSENNLNKYQFNN